MATFYRLLPAVPATVSKHDLYVVAGFSRYALNAGIENHLDAFVFEKRADAFRHVIIFVVRQAVVPLNHGDLAAEAAQRLREFEPNVAAATNDEMLWCLIQFKRLDMRERLRLRKTRNWVQPGSRAGADDDFLAEELACFSICRGDFEGSGPDKTSRTHDQLPSALCVFVAMDIDIL
jgi:hypothetical protein